MEYCLAPWNLEGKGYIFLYKFNQGFINELDCIDNDYKEQFNGGIGCIMLVDYAKSNVGPYGELLFIPGKVSGGKQHYSIPKIYVSSQSSVVNGRRNWGIPKELATFEFKETEKGEESVVVKNDEGTILNANIRSFGPRFPVSTKLLPFSLKQRYENKLFYTSFYGKGIGKLSKITSISVDNSLFPNVAQFKPIAVIKVDNFNIVFPQADVREV